MTTKRGTLSDAVVQNSTSAPVETFDVETLKADEVIIGGNRRPVSTSGSTPFGDQDDSIVPGSVVASSSGQLRIQDKKQQNVMKVDTSSYKVEVFANLMAGSADLGRVTIEAKPFSCQGEGGGGIDMGGPPEHPRIPDLSVPGLSQLQDIETAQIDVAGAVTMKSGALSVNLDWLVHSKTIEPGSVMVVDQSSLNDSYEPYDTRVVGVLVFGEAGGEREGINLGGRGKLAIATAGVVSCRVTTKGGGPIHRGDLLVTSNEEGCAMKASADKLKPGMLLGKSLGVVMDGDAVIKVLLTLQ